MMELTCYLQTVSTIARSTRRRAGRALPWLVLAAAACAWLPALNPDKRMSDFLVDSWATEDGLPQSTIPSVLQTRDGYLWMATYNGLIRFDGMNFRIFDKTNTPSMTNDTITALFEDSNGNLWVGTPGGLWRYRAGVMREFEFMSRLPGLFIVSVREDRAGNLNVCTNKGLACFGKRRKVTVYNTANGLPQNFLTETIDDGREGIWVGTVGGGAALLAGSGIHVFNKTNGLPSDTVWTFCQDRQNRLWIGTQHGLVLRESGRFRVFTTKDGLGGNDVRTLLQDRDGVLWIGFSDGGLTCLKRGRFEVLPATHAVSRELAYSLCEDREGGIWVGTYKGGVHRFRDSRFTIYNTRTGLPTEALRSILQDRQGMFWIGTVGGGLIRFDGKAFFTFGEKEGLRNNRIWSLAEDRDGSILIGTYGSGLQRMKNGRITTVAGIPDTLVRSLLVDSRDRIWVGTNNLGAYCIEKNGKVAHLSTQTGLSDDFVYSIAEDSGGGIWFGMYNGEINVLRDGRITVYGPKQGLSQNCIWAIVPDRQGDIWIGTNNGGLKRFRNGQFTTYTMKDGLYNDIIFQILEDRSGNMWMNCNRGFFRVRKQDLNDFASGKIQRIRCTGYSKADGISATECGGPAQPAGWKAGDGKLWFPTMRGLTVIDPEYDHFNKVPPVVRVEDFLVDGTPLPLDGTLEINPGSARFEFRYAALSFEIPRKVRYKYILENFDAAPCAPVDSRVAVYTNLPPGEYTFRVYAENCDGIWNFTGAAVRFRLKPFFYQTRWFYLLCGVACLALVIGLHRLQVRSLRRRKNELAAQVQARTRELQETNSELEKTNELKNELMAITAHDLKNPLQGIMGFAEMIQQMNGTDSKTGKMAGTILQATERMLAQISDLMQATNVEKGKLLLDIRPVALDPLLQRIFEHYREVAGRKNQTIVLDTGGGLTVNADERLLREIVENLVSNAVKYSPFDKTIHLSARRTDGKTALEVLDEGPGLTTRDKERLFGKFQRLSARPTGGESSTGLGLYIVKQLVEAHGGNLRVESEPGRGSCFIVEIPN